LVGYNAVMSDSHRNSRAAPRFATTRWSVVLSAGQRASPDSDRALASLCEAYWYPLYAFVRRQGRQPAEAQDMTQAFFARLLEKDYLQAADQQRGRFRTFLLTMFKRFLANEYQRANAQKRGGGKTALSLDFSDGERRLQREPQHDWTAERVFERRWALTLLEHVLARVGDDYAAKGKGPLFEQLRPFLTGEPVAVCYREIADQCGLSENAVKVAAHRLRQRYRDALRSEIAQTVAAESDVDDELQQLMLALRGEG
jgi:RNA polymerase sigma-70 factor (ECF subfamily)